MRLKDFKYAEILQQGIKHVGGHAELDEDFLDTINRLNKNFYNKRNLNYFLLTVSSKALANSMVIWFEKGDLQQVKQWSYLSAKAKRMHYQIEPYAWFPSYEFLSALLSDNQEIIDWYAAHQSSYNVNRYEIAARDNPKSPTFHGYQMILALNNQWDELRERCERILSMELKRDKKYLVDHRFYLGLANGDQAAMEKALAELTSPKIAKVRNYEFAFGLTEQLIATHAVIYAKLAWLKGYPVQVNTPWIPKEWLPIKPLENYVEPWEFMQKFDLWTPLDAGGSVFEPYLQK